MASTRPRSGEELPEPAHPALPGGWLAIYKGDLTSRRPEPPPADDGRAEGERKLKEWLEDVRPRNAVERDLLERAAHLAWASERARKAEAAALARAGDEARRKALDRAEILGRRLLGELSAPRKNRGAGGELAGVLVRRLESFAEGCQWLIDRWTAMAAVVASRRFPGPGELYRMIRLLGKEPLDAPYDEEVNGLLAALDADEPGAAEAFLQHCREAIAAGDPAFRNQIGWSRLGPPVEEKRSFGLYVLDLVARQHRRLEPLRDRHLAVAPELAVDADLLRQQVMLGRELRQVVEQLRKLRKAPVWVEQEAEASEEKAASAPQSKRVGVSRRRPRQQARPPASSVSPAPAPTRKRRRVVMRC